MLQTEVISRPRPSTGIVAEIKTDILDIQGDLDIISAHEPTEVTLQDIRMALAFLITEKLQPRIIKVRNYRAAYAQAEMGKLIKSSSIGSEGAMIQKLYEALGYGKIATQYLEGELNNGNTKDSTDRGS